MLAMDVFDRQAWELFEEETSMEITEEVNKYADICQEVDEDVYYNF